MSMEKRTAKSAGAPRKTSYNDFKTFEGMRYTGMKVGRSHHWHYEPGDWKETKITPDLWQVNYAVTKRRAGRAPEGSGVPVGTEYHWYVLAHQNVRKLDANAYTTSLTGLKFKIAHKRAGAETWSATEATQRKRMIAFLQSVIDELEKPENAPAETGEAGEAIHAAARRSRSASARSRPASSRSRAAFARSRAASPRSRAGARPRANGRGRAARVH